MVTSTGKQIVGFGIIVHLDDEPSIETRFAARFVRRGYDYRSFPNTSSAKAWLDSGEEAPACFIIDALFSEEPNLDKWYPLEAMNFIKEMREMFPRVPIIGLSTYLATLKNALDADSIHDIPVYSKSINSDEFERLVAERTQSYQDKYGVEAITRLQKPEVTSKDDTDTRATLGAARKMEVVFERFTKALGEQSWILTQRVTDPFVIRLRLPAATSEELDDFCESAELTFDGKGIVKADNPPDVFIGLFPSGAVHTVRAAISTEGKTSRVTLNDLLSLVDPNATDNDVDQSGYLQCHVVLIGVEVPKES